MSMRMTGVHRLPVAAVVVLASSLAPMALAAQPATAGPETVPDKPTVSSGLSLLTLAGSFDYANRGGSESAQMNWALAYSYLLTDHLALGGGITTHTDWEDSTNTTTTGEISVNPMFFPPIESRLHPYLALRFGLGFGNDKNPVSAGAGVGVMYLLGSRQRGAGLGAEALYEAQRTSEQTTHRVMVALGVTLYLR